MKEIINKSPKIIKRASRVFLGYIPQEVLFGKRFKKQYEFLQEAQWWSEEEHKKYQINELKKLLIHCYNNVPYYTKLFNKIGFNVHEFTDFSDLKKIPYLTKDIIRENLKDLKAKNYPNYKIEEVTTGGSTGLPMAFYIEGFNQWAKERAFVANEWSKIGYNPNKRNKFIVLRGKVIPGIYEKNGLQLILSSFKITNENISEYIKQIEKFDADYIHCYPSALYLIAKYLIDNKISIKTKNLKGILCVSENLYNYQRNIIEDAFKTRVFSFYGHTEMSCIAGECEHSNYYHICSEYGYTEIIDRNGNEVVEEDEVGEIIATGFNNYVTPFIRYKTQDMVINSNKKCKCGRNYKIIKSVEGRAQDYFIDNNGELITFIFADGALWNVKNKIFAYQYVQNKKGEVELNIQSKEPLLNLEIDDIEKLFNEYYPSLKLNIKFVNNIAKTSSGKFRYLIQNININI